MGNLSTKEFKKIIRDETKETALQNGWDINKVNERGFSFQLWIANLFCGYDQGIDTDPEVSMLYSKDLGADIILEDSVRQHLYIIQCKYLGLSKSKTAHISESQLNDFFNRHDLFMDRAWIEKHGSKYAKELLSDYCDKFNNGYTIDYYFVSTGIASERILDLAEKIKSKYFKNERLDFILLDFHKLKDYYCRSLSVEESIPSEISIDLQNNKYFEIKSAKYPTIVTVIKGNSLRNLYNKYKESLFAWNIRGYLGDRGINSKIKETAKERPSEFYYFNNGVSAVCTNYYLDNGNLIAENFQIINGAQTVGAIGRIDSNESLEVLLRLTKTSNVKTDKGINSDIILYNNTQNIIKVSDFRSNDQIQQWLENEIKLQRPKGTLPKIWYARKRSAKRQTGRKITLEELAKVRYSFLYEPTLVLSAPRELWTMKSQGGKYEKSFGVNDEIPSVYSNYEFELCLLAIAFYLKICSTAKKEGKENDEL